MAATKGFRVSARTTAGEVVSSDTVDRDVFVYMTGPALQRIAFSEGDLGSVDSGFVIPRGGVRFRLQAGDPIWMTGRVAGDNESSLVYFLVTKAA